MALTVEKIYKGKIYHYVGSECEVVDDFVSVDDHVVRDFGDVDVLFGSRSYAPDFVDD
jgi:pyoverdine/dityrosine biosynthesis protein Dit1